MNEQFVPALFSAAAAASAGLLLGMGGTPNNASGDARLGGPNGGVFAHSQYGHWGMGRKGTAPKNER